ncbi:ribonuclease [Trypanosoma grayi]|uniref:ribonuclease n=1 Tax=Trypanosoma grayi TaxID=71804 RepID=UPI0004F47913|nr:ribonuclease [Trypanosoma grayi]KEG12978.1 ribonuclease [Trypanosoma grayi]
MKSITNQNFAGLFPEFVRDLCEASYIAIDLEFSGIDHASQVDFLRSPEKAFEEKMAAARLFCPMQIGFSIFSGDGNVGDDTRTLATEHGKASPSYRTIMAQEARAFRASEAAAQPLKSLLESLAAKGAVEPEDLARMTAVRQEVESACVRGGEMLIYDQLRAYHALDEVDAAIAIAKRWSTDIKSCKRHLFVRGYSCYLFPASGEDGEDRTVTLSAETIMFLQKNNMDFSRWVAEGLHFEPFENYAKARREAARAEGNVLPSPSEDLGAGLNALKKWVDALTVPELKLHLISAYDRIARFAQFAEVGDSIESRLPFIVQPHHAELANLLQGIGVRHARRMLTKVPLTVSLESLNFNSNPRYFGTRVLEALVTATRHEKKPLVIHNGLSDLAFLCCAMHCDPPKTLKTFKRLIREIFPVFYDTRTLTCAQSLQHIPNMKGPLKKTYILLQRQNNAVNIHCGKEYEVSEVAGREHDAAYDAFMTGALFAYVQSELAQVGADYRRLRGITPLYGCVFSIQFENDEADCLVQPPQPLIYLVHRPPHAAVSTDLLRDRIIHLVKHVAFLYNGDSILITIGRDAICPTVKREIEVVLRQWCDGFSLTLTALDVEPRMKEYGIVYVSETER